MIYPCPWFNHPFSKTVTKWYRYLVRSRRYIFCEGILWFQKKKKTLEMTSSRCLSVWLTTLLWYLRKRVISSYSRHSHLTLARIGLSIFENCLGQVYPVELEIKGTKQHFCLLPRFTPVHREERSTSNFHVWQTWRFQLLSVLELQYSIFTRLWNVFFLSCSLYVWYVRTCSSYRSFILRATRRSNTLPEHGYVKERLKSSL